MDFKDLAINLKAYSDKYNLLNQALKSCLIAIENNLQENPDEGYPMDKTEIKVELQSFVFHHDRLELPYVKTYVGLYYRTVETVSEDDLIRFGYYTLITNSQGELIDDCLVIET